ncbi:2-succinyl-5-enolpyruvyl-6-hydroxy-3-cyclohexene-1-carboxylic-acid synthase [Macrococcus equipercicus]|uniref:2-succinyl-5-enolpyruvyl-6-hydroxy-3-cyclohexene-1-carboxylate synthase n=1 Tax=Macrococcus equipercicus TaxID=69967 RepID=A0ABQ6R7M5_9STAP|nr:2-succinyl-5-enolpyruvyl-6-hydroxy-3-cyclohexene-1-carboxylic-acid synthase [Macrococcus equipercicus]KAA1039097.1 2-succinyl-5-enolpyruvyl-6-hydroxy-3-cyclohexene-1-carboxylic-acid synthase [Macrococcus equipercicus]
MKNEQLTKQVFKTIKGLYDYGVHEVVISPGSRSTPLAMACEVHPKMTTYIHPDERSAAFFALGLIKATKRPVAVICTSGTAASNYMPAVSEAFISRLPLVVITSDRPHELRNVGAPQAINQVRMFTNFVNYEVDFPLADDFQSPHNFVDAVLLQASRFFSGPESGPVHFNMPFREPLVPDLSATELLTVEPKSPLTYQKTVDLEPVRQLMKRGSGMIIVGDCQNVDLSQLLLFAAIHQLPVFADPLSHLRHQDSPYILSTGDTLFKVYKNFNPGYIIRVGKPVVSKAVNQWLAAVKSPQILVQNTLQPDTFPVVPDIHLEMTANDCFRQLAEESPVINRGWFELFAHLNAVVVNVIGQHIHSVNDEGTIFARLARQLKEDDVIFLGNSMPIRDCDTFFIDGAARPYCNRGANGIDGVVSTAMGMAVHKKVTLVIGDISFFHDMNGLIMRKLEDIDIRIIVMNNNGGGIFSYLPQKEEELLFERLYGTPLDLDFEHTAKLYGFNYQRHEIYDKIQLPSFGAHIIEVMTNRQDNVTAHEELTERVREAVYAELSLNNTAR